MKMQWFARLMLVALVTTLLAACAGKKGDVSYYRPPEDKSLAGNKVARAYGVSSGDAYQLAQSSDKAQRFVNPLRAPANQVYYFGYDQSGIQDSDTQALDTQARYLATHPSAKIRLEGNTDDRGSREYNVALGWRRDQAVMRLLQQQGVSPNQVEMISYGKEHPAVLGDSEKAWSLNRRVNFIYKAY